ncbi:MAG: DUF262 domain-containing protein [Candidatus Omnitrophica bacterium]|nr:DUF262 domain-containing protein [Candidatus Omnitrophota bacterium]
MLKNKKEKTEKEEVDQKAIENIDESSSEIKKPFDPTQITITVKPLIIDSLIKRMESRPMRIDLNPEFQRRGNLWKEEVQSRLIESLLVRIPLPAFYFDGTNDDKWEVVDGLQRLYTLKNFVIDKTLKLQNLEYLKKYQGATFDTLPQYLQGRIEETHITAYIINPGTPSVVKFNIFKRINTGGLPLKPQEIRHALNQGIPADFVEELANLKEFAKATNYALVEAKRMEDRDFVTRFIAFYNGYENYQPDLDAFLNNAMSNLRKLTDDERKNIRRDFVKAMKASYGIFGKDAFRKKYNKTDKRKLLNKAIFDAVSVNLAKSTEDKIDKLLLKKGRVGNEFIKLMNIPKFEKAITSGTGKYPSIKYRFDQVEKALNRSLK